MNNESKIFCRWPLCCVTGRMWWRAEKLRGRSSSSSSKAGHRRSEKTSSRKQNSVEVGPTSRWISSLSWNGCLTRRITRTRSWGRNWVRGLVSPRLVYRWGTRAPTRSTTLLTSHPTVMDRRLSCHWMSLCERHAGSRRCDEARRNLAIINIWALLCT